ncbi:hypothetical protein NY78_2221 [Desulfovibrio sp. TomC]|nr:hypothetical protein NY78_2221 [Desulfovibrio sp. TomC]
MGQGCPGKGQRAQCVPPRLTAEAIACFVPRVRGQAHFVSRHD